MCAPKKVLIRRLGEGIAGRIAGNPTTEEYPDYSIIMATSLSVNRRESAIQIYSLICKLNRGRRKLKGTN